MLQSLHIENIAVIKSLDLDLGEGFSVLSGETGAGKSIILDSLNLLLGNRVSRDLIRTGESRAAVSAVFADLPPAVVAAVEEMGFACEVTHDLGGNPRVAYVYRPKNEDLT